MSKVKDVKPVVSEVVPGPVAVVAPSLPVPAPVPNPKIAEEDRLALELAKSRRETALAQAKEAVAKNDTADLAYKYVVLQIYMKYGLNQNDALTESGDIVRGGALPPQGQ